MLQVNPNERKEVTIVNQKLVGFAVNAQLYSAANNVYVTSQDINFAQTLLKVTLKRDGHTIIILQDDLRTLGLHRNLTDLSRRAFYQDHAFGVTLQTPTAGLPSRVIVGFEIRLPGVLELKGTDQLIVECTLNPTMFSAGVNTSTSYMEIKPIKTTAFEKFVPLLRSYAITAGERRKSFDIGSNVMGVTLLNFDQTAYTTPVVQSITLSSSKMDDTFSYSDLVNSKLRNRPDPGVDLSFPSFGNTEDFDQCFVIIEDNELDKVNIDIAFNPAAVTAGNNVLVVTSAYTDIKTLIEHEANVLKAQNEKLATLKQNGENATIA